MFIRLSLISKIDIASRTIVKKGSKWILKSKTTGKVLGTFDTKEEAEKREKQIQFFKHKKGQP